MHIKFRDTALFTENIALLREKNGGAEMVGTGIHNKKEAYIDLIFTVPCVIQERVDGGINRIISSTTSYQLECLLAIPRWIFIYERSAPDAPI